jgi:Cu(I)/Ag(I) efflux system membrane protein CusA/SilA
MLGRVIRFCLEQKFVVLLVTAMVVSWGALVAPFDWDLGGLPREPVPVDAIPDIGENQQIVFTEWPGRSPQDIDDQVSYPLTVSMLGIPGVRSIRSYSIFGISSIYVIFHDDVDFYWSRARILEKLNSLPAGTLPDGVTPALGPDATALGQVFWYTLEGRDEAGEPTGGWDLHELRSIQDWTVRYALMSAEGVAEVASVGGFVREYQIDVDPDAMRAYGVTLGQVFAAVRASNVDVGARTIEVNKAEYLVRGLGFIERPEDIEIIAVAARDDVPVFIRDVAHVTLGPALRRGALDKGGAEAVGGVVVVRYGANPKRVIENVKAKIAEVAAGLPSKTLADGRESRVTIVPFYDRTGLIDETLQTLSSALEQQVLVTIIVVVVMLLHLRTSLLLSTMLPLAVLLTFIGMKVFRVDANIVALSGIAIAVGTIVDVGIVLTENILRRLEESDPDESQLEVVYRASTEVGSAVLTAVLTTVVGFLPVFTMEAAEGKLFKPLAWTKTFALIASIIIALTILPPLAHLLFTRTARASWPRQLAGIVLLAGGIVAALTWHAGAGVVLIVFGLLYIGRPWLPDRIASRLDLGSNVVAALIVLTVLVQVWEPLGPERGFTRNTVLVGGAIGVLLLLFYGFRLIYAPLLAFALRNKVASLLGPAAFVVLGLTIWLGFPRVFGWLPDWVRARPSTVSVAHAMPGLGKEFMPALDEGSFLYMPTTMPHASIGEALDVLQKLDMAIAGVPEVDEVVGKIGRAETSLDPAPISMVETIISYKSEYMLDADGRRQRFRVDPGTGGFARDDSGELVPDPDGEPFRQWREAIRSPQDIWNEIVAAAELPGTTSAPKLQPIETRIVMLQSGFRAPMGVKVFGPTLESIEAFGLELEQFLRDVPSIEPSTVFAERIVGKPYLEIDIDRERIARYGIGIRDVQDVIEVAIGGRRLTMTVEGRERYPVRVRYMRELRDQIETLGEILVPARDGRQVPLAELATINYVRGPQMIKSEDTFLVGYVLFDKRPEFAEVDVVEAAQQYLDTKIAAGDLVIPAGVTYRFAGSYENQVRASKRLAVILPLSLAVIFLILYFQFRSVTTSLIVFSGVFLAWSGGFVLIWLYGQPWFLDGSVFGTNLRELFQIGPVNLSVAVWVGFLALFGIATDNGVVLATLLRQVFERERPSSIEAIRAAALTAGRRRLRACLMTTATTILALLPVLTSRGRGADIMVPMAIPSVGGMIGALLTLFVVPLLYCAVEEWKLRWRGAAARREAEVAGVA